MFANDEFGDMRTTAEIAAGEGTTSMNEPSTATPVDNTNTKA